MQILQRTFKVLSTTQSTLRGTTHRVQVTDLPTGIEHTIASLSDAELQLIYFLQQHILPAVGDAKTQQLTDLIEDLVDYVADRHR